MPWTCRYHESRPKEAQPGDMWPEPEMIEGELAEYYRKHWLSEEYFQVWYGKRPPLMVTLPNGTDFCVDRRPSSGGSGWTVTGTPPHITVSPSINDAPGKPYGYHGWLRDGVLSDDVDGRPLGRLVP